MNEVQFFLLFKTIKGNFFSNVGLCSIKMPWKTDMKNLIRMLLRVIIAITITACATTSVQKSYINIRQPEMLIEENTGKEFEVLSGDSLKILETKSCPEGKGVCWKVSSAKTGKIGFVNADLMQERQEVYIEENKRTFANGTLQSKYPKVTIKINPEYKYAGFVSEKKDVMSVGGSRELFIKNDRYMFVAPFKYKKDNGEKENVKQIKTEVTKTFIKVRKFDKIYFGGEVLYTVNPGDTLEKLYSKVCLGGYGECWGVRNLKDGQIGIINASRAKLNHQIYQEKDIQKQNLPIKKDEYRLKSGITITFRQVETYFSGELFSKVKNRLYAGVEQYADKNYQYFIRKSFPSMKGVVTRYLYEKGGYVVPLCLLQKGIGRVVGPSQDMMILIHYYEELSEHGFSCSAFPINGKFLNDEEIKFIEEFNERAKLAFEIVYSHASSVIAQEVVSKLDDTEAGPASFVIVSKSDPAFTVFIAVPKEQLQEMKSKVTGEKDVFFVEWSEFSRNKDDYLLSSILVNEYPDSRVADGVHQLLERTPGIPFGITWNGGVAFTSGDYEYVKKTYNLYMSNPEEYRRNRPRTEPVTPELHFGPLLGW